MLRRLRRLVASSGLLVFTVLPGGALAAWGAHRLVAASDRATCNAWADAHGLAREGLCSEPARVPRAIPRTKAARAQLAEARRLLDAGESASARAILAAVLTEVEALDRVPSIVARLCARALLDETLTTLETPAGAPLREPLLAGRRLRGVEELLLANRLEILTNLDDAPPPGFLVALRFRRALPSVEDARALAAQAGDAATCRANAPRPYRESGISSEFLCPRLAEYTATEARLRRLQAETSRRTAQ